MNYIENLQILIQAVEREPELNLDRFRKDTTCGTLFCVAGLLPVTRHFADMGIWSSTNGAPHLGSMGIGATVETLFGSYGFAPAYDCLCESYGDGLWDGELNPDNTLTHKDLALARLRKALSFQQERTGEMCLLIKGIP